MDPGSKDFSECDTVLSNGEPTKRDAVYLPPEILFAIISFVQCQYNPRRNLHTYCLVSRSWYSAAVVQLYRSPVITQNNYRLFVRTMRSSKKVSKFTSQVSKCVKTIDLSDAIYDIPESMTKSLVGRVKGGLEVFIAPETNTIYSAKALIPLSKCQKLVRLDLSLIHISFSALDLLRAVSRLSSLKVFHFPLHPAASSDPGSNDNGRNNQTPWPESLETFHIPSALDIGYIPAFVEAPASIKSLVIEDDGDIATEVLDSVFRLIGSRILTLKVRYEEPWAGLLTNIFVKFPNLLHLSIRSYFVYCHVRGDIDLTADHPLRSLTISQNHLTENFHSIFLKNLKDLLREVQLLNVTRLLLSSQFSFNRWAMFLQENPSAVIDPQLLDIGKILKQRGSSTNDVKETGIWLVDDEDSGATICELTEEIIARIRRGG